VREMFHAPFHDSELQNPRVSQLVPGSVSTFVSGSVHGSRDVGNKSFRIDRAVGKKVVSVHSSELDLGDGPAGRLSTIRCYSQLPWMSWNSHDRVTLRCGAACTRFRSGAARRRVESIAV